MAKKITQEEFLNRFYSTFSDKKIQIIDYTAISAKCTIKCLKCNQILSKNHARDFLNNCNCGCENENKLTKYEKILNLYSKKFTDFAIVKKVDKDNIIIKHKVCGNEFKRQIGAAFQCPTACKYCKTSSVKNMLSIFEVQQQINIEFGAEKIKILDYKGQLEKNHYKCLRCGFIFVQKHISLIKSKGCPKCDRKIASKGEEFVRRLLIEKNLNFKEQVQVPELPLQKFDFGIYENEKIKYFIEVQGDQHYKQNNYFRDSLEVIQERDNRKRLFCKQYHIPLYELKYIKGKFLNLDILPF